MTAEEMKAAETGVQSAPLPLEGVDISPKQDEGVLKVGAMGAQGLLGAGEPRASVAAALPPSLEAPGRGDTAGTAASPAFRPVVACSCSQRPVASPSWTRLRSLEGRTAARSKGGLGARASPGPFFWPPESLWSGLRRPAPQHPPVLQRLGPGRGPGLQRQLRRARCSRGGGGGRGEERGAAVHASCS